MALDPDRYERDWGDFGEEKRHRKISHGRVKTIEEGASPKEESTKEQLEVEAAEKILRHIENRWGDLAVSERNQKLKVYFKWVKSSLDEGYAILDDGDLSVREENEKVVLTHEPTLIGGKKKTKEEARGIVFERLENHLNLWKNTSQVFRESIFSISEVEEAQKPEVLFIFSRHADKDVARVWEQASSADIIIQEAFGSSDEVKQAISTITHDNKIANDPGLRIRLKDYLLKKHPNASGFIKGIIERSVLSGKELHFVDVPLDNQGALESRSAEDAYKEARNFARLGLFESSYSKFVDSQMWDAKSMITRDMEASLQIINLISENKERWKGKKVAIIYGTSHTGIYRTVKREVNSAKLSRTFLDTTRVFNMEHEIKQRVVSGKGFSHDLELKNFLSRMVLVPYLLSFNDAYPGIFDIAEKIARKMTAKDVDSAFERLGEIEKGIKESDIETRLNEIGGKTIELGRQIAFAVGSQI